MNAKGMTPITKNIRVIDEHGNEYEATYLKRAKGLVKNGRARFIDESTLQLACPPNMEDTEMENTNGTREKDVHQGEPHQDNGITLEWISATIGTIINDKTHITEVIEAIHTIKDTKDEGNQQKIEHLTRIVREREETNRKTLSLLETMYKDKTPNRNLHNELPKHVVECMESEHIVEVLKSMFAITKSKV